MINKIIWLIQVNLMRDDSVRQVWESAKACGADVREAIIIPFQDYMENHEEITQLHSMPYTVIIPYGSCKLTRIAHQNNWHGGCYNPDTFSADVWNANRDDMLNADSHIMTVKEATTYFDGKDLTAKWFIRPLEDLKAFSGTVAEAAEIANWMHSKGSGNSSFSENTKIIIASVKPIFSEARYFVVDGKVVDGSYYRLGGRTVLQNVNQKETLHAAQQLADKWLPHKCCVMDIADTPEGTKVIEFNTLNSSGFYDHNIPVIVDAVTEWARSLR